MEGTADWLFVVSSLRSPVSVVDEIKERLDIVDVLSGYVSLKKAGRNYKGLCPFHSEKTPSLVVFPETQTWHCFGCNVGGDLFNFVMRQENMEFGEALRLLAERAGVRLRPERDGAKALGKLKDRLHKINSLAAEYFHYLLLNSPEGARAREYLAERGITEDARDLFGLGCAREDWQALGNHLTSRGYSWSDLLEAGLALERQGGGYYDRFRGRLLFPIRDVRGHAVGFGARALDDSVPKYLNSPQTPIFDKSSVLYGIDKAKRGIREQGFVVIVEGYMDVLMAHQHGRGNVVASMGTALTEKQVRVIKKLTKKLVLALDADTAGDQATLRGLDVAKGTFDRRAVPVPTWRGLVRYEDQLDAEIRVVVLPPGLDPDEVIRADLSSWDALVSQALPVVEYYLKSVAAAYDLDSPKDKAVLAREVLPLIEELRSPVERSHYLQQLARMLHVDERVLQQEALGKKVIRREGVAPIDRLGRLSAQPGLTFGLERYVLLLLIDRPDLLAPMNNSLTELDLGLLTGEDFASAEERALFEFIVERILGDGAESVDALQQEIDPALRPSLEGVLSRMEEAALLSDDQAKLDAETCALRLRESNLLRRSEELRYLLEDARAEGDTSGARMLAQRVNGLATHLSRIQKAKAAQTALKSMRSEVPQI
jgi:DNA primase